MKKKLITIGSLLLVLIVISFIAFFPSRTGTKKESKPSTTQTTYSKEKEEKTQYSTNNNNKNLAMLEDFGNKWINYSSIYNRNQSVKELFTQQAITDNSLNVDPHVEIRATGTITTISQSMTEDNKFVLVGIEKTNNNPTKIFLEIEIEEKNNQPLISKLTVSYVRGAY
jgi:hypothetical protein